MVEAMKQQTPHLDTEYLKALVGAMSAKRSTKLLKYFSNDVRMELLFSIWRHEGDLTVGMLDYIAGLSTAPKTNSGMQLFLREMVSLGCFEVVDGEKASRKHLYLSDCLRSELTLHVMQLMERLTPIDDADVDLVARHIRQGLITEH